jgi:2-polyprenyl-3-methyl-5-hydroxy-6-metoxy-1,4-benzoquinol methylase
MQEEMEMPLLVKELEALNILNSTRLSVFYPRVRDREDIAVLRDAVTEVMVLSSADHMSIEYYKDKLEEGGNRVNGSLVNSPTLEDDVRRAKEFGPLLRGKKWLDFGCGLGGVLEEVKGQPAWAAGLEPSCARAAIAKTRGHTVLNGIDQVSPAFLDVISLFHVLEHLTSPLETLKALSTRLKPGGLLIIEVPHARDALFTLYDSEAFKRFTFWSEHLVLHTRQSLRLLLEAAGLVNVEITGKQRYPMSNHLHWLSKGKPGGHEAWAFLDSAGLHAEYEASLSRVDRTDTLIAFARIPT